MKNEHGIVNNGVLCYKCGIVYTTADELENHQNEKHGKLDYICKFCDLNLNDLNGYNNHLKDNHKDYSKNFKCKSQVIMWLIRVCNHKVTSLKWTMTDMGQWEGSSSVKSLYIHQLVMPA